MRETTGTGDSPDLDSTVAANIRAELARRQLRHGHVARELGRTNNWLSRRLTGEVSFTLSDLDELARAIGVPLAELLTVGTAA